MKPKEWDGMRSFRFREDRLKRRAILKLLLERTLGDTVGRADEDMVQIPSALLALPMDVDASVAGNTIEGWVLRRDGCAGLPGNFEMNGHPAAPEILLPAGSVANRDRKAFASHD